MVMVYLLFVVGLVLLVKSANWIVGSSTALAKRFGVSTFIVGLTIVAFGTTLPEFMVSLFAALKGAGGVSFGNIVGTNIANVLLVLGIAAIVGDVKLKKSTVWKGIPFALLASFVLFVLTSKIFFSSSGNFLGRSEGLIFLSLFAIFLYYVFQNAKHAEKAKKEDMGMSKWSLGLRFFGGIVGIYLGGMFVVDGAVAIAGQLGLSEFLISATIIAVGTSLPELAVCVTAVLKKNPGLAVGNIIGSNVINIFWTLGLISLIKPISIPAGVGFDIGVAFLAMLLFFVFMFVGKKHAIGRRAGIAFVVVYALYVASLVIRG